MKRITYNNEEEWHYLRSLGIGGSSVSTIMGVNKYESITDLWLEKTKQKERKNLDGNKLVEYGSKAEEHIRELFKLNYENFYVFHSNEMLVHDEYEFIRGNLDGEIECLEDIEIDGTLIKKGQKGVLEIKTSLIRNASMKKEWGEWRYYDEYSSSKFIPKIPENYFYQCLYYLLITGYDFVVLHAELRSTSNRFSAERVTYAFSREDVEHLLEPMKQEVIKFWNENVIEGKRPAVVIRGEF